MAANSTTKLLLLLCVLMLPPLVMEMMPLAAQSAGTSCGALILLAVYTVWENYFLLPFYCKQAILKYGLSGQQYMMQFGFIIKLVCCLSWLCGLAFGQSELSDALTGSVTFPALGITCLVNLAFFYRFILKGMHNDGTDVKKELATLKCLVKRYKLKNLNQLQGLETCRLQGLTTCPERVGECHVVMLSMQMPPNSSMEDFMRVMCDVHKVYSIILRCLPVGSESNAGSCSCTNPDDPDEDWRFRCACIEFRAVEEIEAMLNNQIPGIVKRLSDSHYLLPCWFCLRNGCHLGHQGPSQVECHVECPSANFREVEYSQVECPSANLREVEYSQVECPAAVCELLPFTSFMSDVAPCICLPLRLAKNDGWTKQLVTFFEIRAGHGNEAVVPSALKNYISESGECDAYENYNSISLVIVPALTRAFIICALTFWFKVDGFSSMLFAMKATEGYFPYKRRLWFSPIAFLRRAVVRSNPKNTNACQVLWFRVSRLHIDKLLDYMFAYVWIICTLSWMVLVAMEGGANKWYHTHSMSPSEARVAVIIAAIAIAVAFDLYQLLIQHRVIRSVGRNFPMFGRPMPSSDMRTPIIAIRIVIVVEILCIVSGTVALRTLGIKVFGRWLYSAVQCLVLIKFTLGGNMSSRPEPLGSQVFRKEGGDGRYVYASAFFLNGILAGVRAKWEFS